MRTVLISICFFVVYAMAYKKKVHAEPTVDGGLGMHISNRFLDSIKFDLFPQIFDKLESLSIPDQEFNMMVLKAYNVTGQLKNIKVRNVECDLKSTVMKFETKSPNILINLINVSLNFTFDYSLETNPDKYRDVGNATIYFNPLNITLGMTTYAKNGMLQIGFIDFNYQFDDYTFNFTGEGKLSFLISAIADSVKDIIKTDLSPNIFALMHLLLQPQINEYFFI